MSRNFVNIRLSYEAKLWLEELQAYTQQVLDDSIKTEKIDADQLELNIKEKLEDIDDVLGGVSITNIFKVSASSILEKAFYDTRHYTHENWMEIDALVKNYKTKTNIEVGTLTPRLYLDTMVIDGLEQYRRDFKKEDMVRIAKTSYVIKNIIFAYYREIFLTEK